VVLQQGGVKKFPGASKCLP